MMNLKNKIKQGGFIKCGWDGSPDTETKIKNDTKATVRCILFDQNISSLNVFTQISQQNMKSFFLDLTK